MAQKIHTTTTGDVTGNTLGYTFDFPSLSQDDIRVSVAGVLKTLTSDYTIGQWSATGSTSNFIQFVNSTKRGTGNVRIFRETPKTAPKASYTSGSAIKADDLNINQKQAIYIAGEFEDDMTNLAANDATGFQINGSNIADNSITTTKIAGLEVNTEDINNGAVTSNKLSSSTSSDSGRAVDTDHIKTNAVTSAKIAGLAGSKVTPDFGSQTIRTTGHLDVPNRLQTTTSSNGIGGIIFGGDHFGFQTTPGGTPASRVNGTTPAVFLAIGDADTGIVQDGDGQLEIWTNDQEIANFNATSGIFTSKNITANAPGKFIGDGSLLTSLPSSELTGALPPIDGSALLGITSSIKRVKEVSNANEVTFGNTTAWNNHIYLFFDNVASTSRFLILGIYEIKNENSGTSNITYAKIVPTNGNFLNAVENSTSSSSYQRFTHWEFDTAANTTNRQYTLQVRSSNSHSSTNAQVQKAALIGIEFTPS